MEDNIDPLVERLELTKMCFCLDSYSKNYGMICKMYEVY